MLGVASARALLVMTTVMTVVNNIVLSVFDANTLSPSNFCKRAYKEDDSKVS